MNDACRGLMKKKMKTIIQNKLAEIEEVHGLKILFACESGSRGWGFPSPDSDFDVRFIYVKPLHFYLSIMGNDDHLSFPINDELDIYGWDLKKVLKLVGKSNTTPFEWLQSPVIYKEEEGFRNRLWSLCQDYFSKKTNTNHYLGIAKGALATMANKDEIKIKKLFYVLRPLLSAIWCLEKGTIAPMEIVPLMSLMPADVRVVVEALITQKTTTPEGFVVKIPVELKKYIEEQFERCNIAVNGVTKQSMDSKVLNDFFINTISP